MDYVESPQRLTSHHDNDGNRHRGFWAFWSLWFPWARKNDETAENSEPPKVLEDTECPRDTISNSYVITLKESCDLSTHIAWLRGLEEKYYSTPGTCKLIYEYKLANGYVATLRNSALEEVRSSVDVEEIVPNQRVRAGSGDD
ncbi:hypothetical protein FRC12_007852 [Ceratobasidium sp. 428]|nr:hypothetical protein FRC12_007852 [Ceratobasidium sp. 428]